MGIFPRIRNECFVLLGASWGDKAPPDHWKLLKTGSRPARHGLILCQHGATACTDLLSLHVPHGGFPMVDPPTVRTMCSHNVFAHGGRTKIVQCCRTGDRTMLLCGAGWAWGAPADGEKPPSRPLENHPFRPLGHPDALWAKK
jgi:hypothetical protein